VIPASRLRVTRIRRAIEEAGNVIPSPLLWRHGDESLAATCMTGMALQIKAANLSIDLFQCGLCWVRQETAYDASSCDFVWLHQSLDHSSPLDHSTRWLRCRR